MKQYMSEYEKFVFLNSSGSFTQSENWCKIKNEWQSERIIIRDKSGNILGTMQILIKNIPLMNTVFMYAPRGSVCDCHNLDILSKIIEQAKLLAEKHKAYMLKIDPMISYDDIESINNLKRLGFKYNANTPEDNTIQCQRNYILRSGDTLVIKSLDRLSRNKLDIKSELEYYKQNGIRVKVIDMPTTMINLEGQE